jgi:hypothetical protein
MPLLGVPCTRSNFEAKRMSDAQLDKRVSISFGMICPNSLCQETSMRDTANQRSLEQFASIVHQFLDGCSNWYVSVVFLTGQVLGNWKA